MAPSIANPLSALIYIRRNVGKMVPIVLIVAFSVFGLTTAGAVSNSAHETFLRAFSFFHYATVVEPRSIMDMPVLPAHIVGDIQAIPQVDEIYPCINFRVRVSMLANTSALSSDFLVFGVFEEHARELLKYTGGEIIAGRLPRRRRNEVALAAEVARNGGLELGDTFTSADARVEEKYVVVGIIKGRVPLGIASYAYMRTKSGLFGHPEGVLVIPRSRERLPSLNRSLREVVDSQRIRVIDRELVNRHVHTMMQGTGVVLAFIILVVAIVVSIQVALVNVIYLGQRRGEYALLIAIGHSKKRLIYRVCGEILLTSLIGWGVGALFAYGGLCGLRGSFDARGIALNPLAPQAYLSTLPVPVLLVLSSIIAVKRSFTRLDPIEVVERRVE